MYAPTYRDNGKTIYFPFPEMEKNEFESFLKEHDITIYVRPHHLDQGYKKYITWDGIEYFGSDLVPEITFYLKEFDILISDYSSIIFDYMLTDGYQILLPYDKVEYERVRGLNYKIKDLSYGKIVFSYDDFKNSIAFPYENIDRKNKLKNRFHSIDSFQCNKLLNRIIVEHKNERNN
ncbi:CDP-glycerol glycerophosphotransferase family protein [Providencia rettgeri]